MEAKHTPGPWQQHDNAPQYGPCYAGAVWTSRGPGRGLIADCHQSGISPEEQVANARLVAAAPELLAACESVVNWAIRANVICEPEDIGMMDAVNAAIAKATTTTN